MRHILRKQSDLFLQKVFDILNLESSFKFNKQNINTDIFITEKQRMLLGIICEDSYNKRVEYNKYKIYGNCNVRWAAQVLETYFNIKL